MCLFVVRVGDDFFCVENGEYGELRYLFIDINRFVFFVIFVFIFLSIG